MKKIILTILLLFCAQVSLENSVIDNLKEKKKTSYLDFILLKIETKLIQRHSLLGSQPLALRIQYQNVGSQIEFNEEESKIIITIIAIMDKKRYAEKKYKPKISDCNIIRNLLLYGKYGYNLIFQKRNKYLTNEDMEELYVTRFLSNLSLSDKEINYLLKNTFVEAKIIDTLRGNDIFCEGNVARDLK